MKEKTKKKSTLGWVMEFAGIDRNSYIVSVLLAIISVFAGFVPYLFVANIVKALIEIHISSAFSWRLSVCLPVLFHIFSLPIL